MENYKILSDPHRGRKPLSAEDKKSKTITIRLTESELLQVKEKASAEGFKEMAHYIRVHLLNEKTKPLIPVVDRDMLRQINSIGNNLNQIAKDYNSKNVIDSFNLVLYLKKLKRVITRVE